MIVEVDVENEVGCDKVKRVVRGQTTRTNSHTHTHDTHSRAKSVTARAMGGR